jgi:pimeloyl-ACP methyl ester carboxylesterase
LIKGNDVFSHHCKWLFAVLLVVASPAPSWAQPGAGEDAGHTFTVFLRQRPVGQETVSVVTRSDGTLIRGSNRLGPPLDVVTRTAEIHYSPQWHPTRMTLDGTTRGQAVTINTTFANGQASSEIVIAGQAPQSKVDAVAEDTVVLPNAFLGSYAALARRLSGAKPGMALRAYIAPQGEVPMRVDGVFAERIETPRQVIAATRFALVVSNHPPGGDMPVSVWTDDRGGLLRMSVPSQMLEVARDDIASAAARTTSFSIPTDESVHIPASGFNLAASVAKPPGATGLLKAVVVVGGVTAADRDGVVNGVPVLGQLAASLVDAGFLVVRYDRRGVGQSGGRSETATINDYAEDVRAVVNWLEKRKDVDDDGIAVVGHGDGAWVAMRAAERDKNVAALALIQAASTTGADFILEQQREVLSRASTPEAEQQAKIELQQRINAAVLKGSGWEEIPDAVRLAADTPWFQSFLAFDPARVMRDIRQPVVVVKGNADSGVAPSHADRLAESARARRRKVPVEIVEDLAALGASLVRIMG